MTPLWSGLAFAAVCAALFIPSLIERRRRRKAREAFIVDLLRERDYWRSRYHTEVGLIAEVHGADNATYHLIQWEREMGERA